MNRSRILMALVILSVMITQIIVILLISKCANFSLMNVQR